MYRSIPISQNSWKSNWRLLTFPPLLLTVQSRLKCALKYIVFVVLGSVLYQEYFPKVPKMVFPKLYSCNRVKKFLELNNLKITSSIFWNFKIASDWPDLVLRYLKSVNFKWSCILIILMSFEFKKVQQTSKMKIISSISICMTICKIWCIGWDPVHHGISSSISNLE